MDHPALVIHIPHASTLIPAHVREQFVLEDADLERELLLMTDRYVDELFALPAAEAVTVRHEVSRLVLDPERFVDPAREPMERVGMGAVYRATHEGDPEGHPLRRTLTAEEDAALHRLYDAHHARLTAAVRTALDEHGRCLIVDAHSFPDWPLPYEKRVWPAEDPRWKHRPRICLGSDRSHTPLWLQAAAYDAFAARFDPVVFDRPFPGAIVPLEFLGRDTRVASIMVEVRRDVYMDESTGDKLPEFDEVAARIQSAVLSLSCS